MKISFVFLLFAMCLTACQNTATENKSQTTQSTNTPTKTETTVSESKSDELPKIRENVPPTTNSTPDKAACLTAKSEGKKLIANQTFVFDYEPFKGSCFVTFANREEMVDETDVPRGSTFHIYKNGKQVYQFEDAFDGLTGCWVEGVGFEDLNGDGKVEVIIAGSCLGAKSGYPANAVYLNLNDDFKTFPSSNQLLENFKTIKQISDFVKKNKSKFFSDK